MAGVDADLICLSQMIQPAGGRPPAGFFVISSRSAKETLARLRS
jgi:hypothetical protein